MMRFGIVLLCGLAGLGTVEAQCYAPARVVVRKEVVAVQKVAVVEVPIVTKFVAVVPLAVFPSYAAVYAPPPPPPVYSAPPPVQPAPLQQDQMKAIMDALRAIDARLQKLEQSAPPEKAKPKDPFAPQSQTQGDPNARAAAAAKVISTACMACHALEVSAKLGGDFAMSDKDGYLANLDAAAAKKVVGRVSVKKDMPPKDSKHSMTDADRATIAAYYGG